MLTAPGIKMYVYRVGYHSYEESPQRYLTHDVKFDSEEFRQMVVMATAEIFRRWLALPDDCDCESPMPWGSVDQFSHIAPTEIADFLIQERGFRDLDVTASVMFSGWASVVQCSNENRNTSDLSDVEDNRAVTDHLVEVGLADAIDAKNHRMYNALRNYDDEDGQ